MEDIKFVDLDELEDYDRNIVKELAEKYYDKISKNAGEIDSFKVHIKKHDKSGKVSKYSVILKMEVRKQAFEVEKTDWDLAKLMNIAFNALENEIK